MECPQNPLNCNGLHLRPWSVYWNWIEVVPGSRRWRIMINSDMNPENPHQNAAPRPSAWVSTLQKPLASERFPPSRPRPWRRSARSSWLPSRQPCRAALLYRQDRPRGTCWSNSSRSFTTNPGLGLLWRIGSNLTTSPKRTCLFPASLRLMASRMFRRIGVNRIFRSSNRNLSVTFRKPPFCTTSGMADTNLVPRFSLWAHSVSSSTLYSCSSGTGQRDVNLALHCPWCFHILQCFIHLTWVAHCCRRFLYCNFNVLYSTIHMCVCIYIMYYTVCYAYICIYIYIHMHYIYAYFNSYLTYYVLYIIYIVYSIVYILQYVVYILSYIFYNHIVYVVYCILYSVYCI